MKRQRHIRVVLTAIVIALTSSSGGPLTEMVLPGALASRFKDRLLVWDSKTMSIVNDKEADMLINPPYRQGWTL